LNLNWGWILIRITIVLAILVLLFLSQRFWYRGTWRLTGRIPNRTLRGALRGAWIVALILVILATADGLRMQRGHLIPHGSLILALAGLWLSSAFFAYLCLKLVVVCDWLWRNAKLLRARRSQATAKSDDRPSPPLSENVLPNPSRRYFFQTASVLAGSVPFVGALYGFASERLRYQVREVSMPLANLPPALEGLRIVQLSDIHCSGYMTREQVRRAVDMANELTADLAVVTGDFITGASDPLAECIAELARLRAPLGVWGCNGNHEVYAGAEAAAQDLFHHAGMRLLRQENVQLAWRGAPFNLIGVDYQRQRTASGRLLQMLPHTRRLVRRDMPNILLSHNPNSFPRAAELGIELQLTGHTHGGQVQVEILDHRFSPARFFTPFIAGLYQLPLAVAPASARSSSPSHESPATNHVSPRQACLYVNRGLGTVGAPVRIGVPPEITLLTLRRA
jgi:predicted MPP superfamily phosphohydrolase